MNHLVRRLSPKYYGCELLTHSAYMVVVQRFGVGLVIERSLVRLPARALSSRLGQLSFHPCGEVNRVPACMAGVKVGAFACVGWQVFLWDPIC